MKKGFTLVELLAVIAILAILVIIALPNIMSIFNEAKKNSFANEIKTLFKAAEQQYILDGMYDSSDKYYIRETEIGEGFEDSVEGKYKELNLNGRTNLKYGIHVNQEGKIVQLYATDGTYFIAYSSSSSYLKIEDISSEYSEPFNFFNCRTDNDTCENNAHIYEISDFYCDVEQTTYCKGAKIVIGNYTTGEMDITLSSY